MKMSVYLSVIAGIFLLGFALTYFRDKEKLAAMGAMNSSPVYQEYQKKAMQYADTTNAVAITEWLIYNSGKEAVIADGIDGDGRQVIKCVFDRASGCPLIIVRDDWNNGTASGELKAKKPRSLAEWWLKRIAGTDKKREWRWMRDSKSSERRYLSIWQCAEYDASLSLNPLTGQLVALRLYPRLAQPALPRSTSRETTSPSLYEKKPMLIGQ